MNDSYVTELAPTGEGWQLKVKTPGGLSLEYSYASEAQARYFAAVFHLGPSRLPAADRIIPPTRRRTRAVKRVHELDNVSTDEIEGALGVLGAKDVQAAADDLALTDEQADDEQTVDGQPTDELASFDLFGPADDEELRLSA